MGKRGAVELCSATVLFIAVGSAATMARGHLVGDVFIVLMAPVLAAIITLIARAETRGTRLPN